MTQARCPFCNAGPESLRLTRPEPTIGRTSVRLPVECRECQETFTIGWRGRHADRPLLLHAYHLQIPVSQLVEIAYWAQLSRLLCRLDKEGEAVPDGQQDPFAAAQRDLAEFGFVTVPDPAMARRLHRAAEEAGYPARIRKGGKGWWTVEITHMTPPHGRNGRRPRRDTHD